MRRALIFVLALAAVGGLAAAFPDRSRDLGQRGWNGVKSLLHSIRPRPEEAARPEREPVVRVRRLVPQRYVQVRQYHGEIEPSAEARLSFEVAGRIRTIHCRENARVGAGQTLAELDPALFEARRDRAQAELDKALRDLERNRRLARTQVVAQRVLQDSETAVRLHRAALREAAEQLARTRLASPFAGFLVRRAVETGEMAQPGQPAFTVMALDPVKLVVWVPEYRVPELAGRQRCTVEMPAFPGRTFRGEVRRVPLASQQGRMFGVEIRVANPEHLLRPGMIARARVETLELPRAWRFSIDWVRRDGAGLVAQVFVPDARDPERGVLQAVKLVAPFRDGGHWIARGIEPAGEALQLVTAGFEGLASGRRVRRLPAIEE